MTRKIVWRVFTSLAYFAVVYIVFGAATSKFETLVLASMTLLYTAMLYNFSLIATASDINNYAGFVRFRILAAAQGITQDEDGLIIDHEKNLAKSLKDSEILIFIIRISHGIVSLYALYKVITAALFG